MFDQHPPMPDVQRCLPVITTRPATQAEVAGLRPWLLLQGLAADAADVVVFASGDTRHAPETLAAFQAVTGDLPAGFGLLYLHYGVQVLCLDPLLPSLLHLSGHKGRVHALRHTRFTVVQSGLPDAAIDLLHAMTPPGGCTLVIDDRQTRVTAPGTAIAGPVTFSLYRNAARALPPLEHASHDHD